MNYAIILAGGKGIRFKNELPKQYHLLGNKPVLIHTIEKFIQFEEDIKIILVVNKEFFDYVEKKIEEYLPNDYSDIEIVEGGNTRTQSLMNGCNYILKCFETDEKDIIITHDAARPFINSRIIRENIEKLNECDGVSTAIETYNSILEVKNDNIVNVPIRANMKLVQTPQSFRLHEFIENYKTLTKEEIDSLIEATKSYVLRNKNVRTVKGELYNIKITTQYDLKIANFILESKLNK